MHRTTIFRIKLEALFVLAIFCPANIYRPSLGKVWLGRPNPKLMPALNLYLRRKKKTILLRFLCTTTVQILIFNFDFNLILKKNNFLISKNVSKLRTIYIIIINIYIF